MDRRYIGTAGNKDMMGLVEGAAGILATQRSPKAPSPAQINKCRDIVTMWLQTAPIEYYMSLKNLSDGLSAENDFLWHEQPVLDNDNGRAKAFLDIINPESELHSKGLFLSRGRAMVYAKEKLGLEVSSPDELRLSKPALSELERQIKRDYTLGVKSELEARRAMQRTAHQDAKFGARNKPRAEKQRVNAAIRAERKENSTLFELTGKMLDAEKSLYLLEEKKKRGVVLSSAEEKKLNKAATERDRRALELSQTAAAFILAKENEFRALAKSPERGEELEALRARITLIGEMSTHPYTGHQRAALIQEKLDVQMHTHSSDYIPTNDKGEPLLTDNEIWHVGKPSLGEQVVLASMSKTLSAASEKADEVKIPKDAQKRFKEETLSSYDKSVEKALKQRQEVMQSLDSRKAGDLFTRIASSASITKSDRKALESERRIERGCDKKINKLNKRIVKAERKVIDIEEKLRLGASLTKAEQARLNKYTAVRSFAQSELSFVIAGEINRLSCARVCANDGIISGFRKERLEMLQEMNEPAASSFREAHEKELSDFIDRYREPEKTTAESDKTKTEPEMAAPASEEINPPEAAADAGKAAIAVTESKEAAYRRPIDFAAKGIDTGGKATRRPNNPEAEKSQTKLQAPPKSRSADEHSAVTP